MIAPVVIGVLLVALEVVGVNVTVVTGHALVVVEPVVVAVVVTVVAVVVAVVMEIVEDDVHLDV